MKKVILFGIVASVIGFCINAYAGAYVETETVTTYEKFSISNIKYYDTVKTDKATVKPAPAVKKPPVPCRKESSLNIAEDKRCIDPRREPKKTEKKIKHHEQPIFTNVNQQIIIK